MSDVGDLLSRVRQGDEHAFGVLIRPHQVAMFRHCYRMLGSGPDAEDAVQDTLLRAFRAIESYDGRGDFAGWLYRIATNICLDRLRAERRRTHPVAYGPPARLGDELAMTADGPGWVEPVADGELGIGIDPQESLVARETVSLAFLTSMQTLPPRQRAALLLHDVLGFTPLEVAEVLAATPSAVSSLLHRARESAAPGRDSDVLPLDDPRVADLASRYLRAWERADVDGFVAVVTDDIAFSMPPLPQWFSGRDDVSAFVELAIFGPSRPYGVTVRLGRCNGQLAVAVYEPDGSGALGVSGVQVLDLRPGTEPLVAAVTSYRIPELAVRCGFPSVLP
ncbi:MAG: RNA polymerase subunit sigma-70 [Acidimicrobiales bacterium]